MTPRPDVHITLEESQDLHELLHLNFDNSIVNAGAAQNDTVFPINYRDNDLRVIHTVLVCLNMAIYMYVPYTALYVIAIRKIRMTHPSAVLVQWDGSELGGEIRVIHVCGIVVRQGCPVTNEGWMCERVALPLQDTGVMMWFTNYRSSILRSLSHADRSRFALAAVMDPLWEVA